MRFNDEPATPDESREPIVKTEPESDPSIGRTPFKRPQRETATVWNEDAPSDFEKPV